MTPGSLQEQPHPPAPVPLLRSWWRWAGPALAYMLAVAAVRGLWVWRLDATEVLWRAAGFSLPAGALHDAGVAVAVSACWPTSAGRPRWWATPAPALALLLVLGGINMVTLAALHIPASWDMASYLLDVFEPTVLVSPIDIPTGLAVLAGACTILAGAWRLWVPSPLHAAPWRARVAAGAVAVGLLGLAAVVAGRDYRAAQVAFADGASWLWHSWQPTFRAASDLDPRVALLTPAARGEDVFLDAQLPLARAPAWLACRQGVGGSRCDRDADGDGAALRDDCDDAAAGIHPGASDLPGDGVDGDCDGHDADPPDVLILELEGLPARALAATGGDDPQVAPALAAVAARPDAVLFSRFETAGVQTMRGFASAMCSTLPHWGAAITRSMPQLALRCLPAALAERGWASLMVQNGDPAFDRQGAFATRIGFARVEGAADIAAALGQEWRAGTWGLPDASLFAYLGQTLRARTRVDPPLLLVAQSITNHHPYQVPGQPPPPPSSPMWSKLQATSRYVDGALAALVATLESLGSEPGRRPLVVVISGDHGHPSELHEGNSLPAAGLYAENVHTPLVVWAPGHPRLLARLRRGALDAPASSVDVMPTVLGLVGVQTAHAMVGRDLAAPSGAHDWRAIAVNPMAGGLIRVRLPDQTVIVRATPPALWTFAAADLDEQTPLAEQAAPAARAGADAAIGAVMACTRLQEENRVWRVTLAGGR